MKFFDKSALLFTTVLSMGFAAPAVAQQVTAADGSAESPGDIIVTARRMEERLQDVPISISVFNQQQIADRNVSTASDLAAYTPSLAVDKRFGPDQSSFAIRGFTQELRTSSSVAVYFADTVAPRGGSTGTTAGDGAGPGAFFDLQNVQVLKGPQGTLFGRNTTGGAVLLVPQKPTSNLEGYVEGSIGNYDLKRVQAVLNVPLSDTFRIRAGVDRQTRDGYLHNIASKGPRDFADIDYVAARLSIVGDLTPELENYTVASYSRSDNNGFLPQIFACGTVSLGSFCTPQLARARASGDYYAVESAFDNPRSFTEVWQIINTTTWTASDDLTIKNIASYGSLANIFRQDIYGANFAVGTTPFYYITSRPPAGYNSNDQWTFTEELQFQGRAGDRLIWQAGGYYEKSGPNGLSGTAGPTFLACSSFDDPYRCTNVLGPNAGSVGDSTTTISFRNVALYAQGTYTLTDKLKATAGIRYTWDKTSGASDSAFRRFTSATDPTVYSVFCQNPDAVANPTAPVPSRHSCHLEFQQSSSRPTWTFDLEYAPVSDMMIYAKYSRGYRQGVVNPLGLAGFTQTGPEKVDTYELGLKSSFRGAVSGNFNIAGFYNDFRDQQILVGVQALTGLPSGAAIVNAGKSRIWGVEVDGSISPLEGLKFDFGYTYLNTKLQQFTLPVLEPRFASLYRLIPTVVQGGPLVFSPKHKATITATYTLPLPETVGKVSFGATYTFTDHQLAHTTSPFGTLPKTDLVNLNLNWASIGGSPIDASVFVTNLTNEKYWFHIGGQWSRGFESRSLAEPRMYGLRLRYTFGR